MMKENNPRLFALKILDEILWKERKAKDVLEYYSSKLDQRDRAFLQELVYGTLRKRFYIDWHLRPFLRNPAGLKEITLNNLRLGAYQALFMRIPNWAVVNETTEVEKVTGHNSRLVNGVLRKISVQKICPPLPRDPVKNISISLSHPEWLIRRWVRRFGVRETRELASANNMIPPLTLRVNTLRTEREAVARRLAEMDIEFEFTSFSPDGIKVTGSYDFSNIRSLLGDVFIQDEASQLIAYLLQPEEGQIILDACAAPGGKTIHIAELTRERAKIYAMDKNPERLLLMRENLNTHGIRSVSLICSDITNLKLKEHFDRILLDAPCSSLGVIRRNPDVRYRHSEERLMVFHGNQLELLLSVSNCLKTGGVLVYSICSTEPEEGERVIERFLHKRRDFFIIDRSESGFHQFGDSLRSLFEKGYYFRTYPHRHNMDGFFAAILSKK